MTASALSVAIDRASQCAQENWGANLAALRASQSEVVDSLPPVRLGDWLHGRDGSLTYKFNDGQWLAGNSLPRRSAARILRSMSINHTVGCFLDVPHAAFLQEALDRLRHSQAVVAVLPEAEELALLLHCANFSADIARGRLWFAAGDNWVPKMAEVFDQQPGLPVPGAFIRTPLTPETTLQEMIKQAQACFSAASERRAEMLTRICKLRISRQRPSAEASRPACIGVIAPSDFRLWEPSADVLRNLICRQESGSDDLSWQMIDPDLPASASSLALARMAAESDAIVSADIFRSAASGAVPIDLPWIVWATRPSIPPYEGGANDRLILADDGWIARAQRAGWPEKQICIAGWPDRRITISNEQAHDSLCGHSPSPCTSGEGRGGGRAETRNPESEIRIAPTLTLPRSTRRGESSGPQQLPHLRSDQPPTLVLIADTVEVPANPDHFELSSHSLLWETIRQQLLADPFALRIDPVEYLRKQMQQYNVAGEGLDVALFVDQLIIPTYQQSLARILLDSRIETKIYGRGWSAVSTFSAAAAGPVSDSTAFSAAINSGAALLHLWPTFDAHPVTAIGKPVVFSAGSSRSKFLAEARQALDGRTQPARQRAAPLNLRMILSAL